MEEKRSAFKNQEIVGAIFSPFSSGLRYYISFFSRKCRKWTHTEKEKKESGSLQYLSPPSFDVYPKKEEGERERKIACKHLLPNSLG